MGWLGPMAIESKMQPFLTAFNKKLGQQLYHCLKLKATIQASGKLGFPKATSDILRFSERPYVYFLLDDNEEDLYMVLLAEGNEDAFKVITSSGYYSLNTTSIFNELQYDYKNKTIIFDLVRVASLDESCGGETYKMVKREDKESKINLDLPMES